MLLTRRRFLAAASATVALGAMTALPRRAGAGSSSGRRVVVVGGGWGGLSAARHLRSAAPDLDVTLLERNAAFWSCPLSNQWLVGKVDGALLRHDYHAAAHRWGYRFVQAEVEAIDRDRREVVSDQGRFAYDWLVLAVGIRHDYTAWFGEDRETAEFARKHCPPAFTPGTEFAALREKLAVHKGGTLLMTIPPQPFRCPPAPYERAALLAGWFEAQKIPVRIVIVDPNPPFQEYQRIFRERFAKQVEYHSQTAITAVDPRRNTVESEFDSFVYDAAILMPPQQAGTLAWQAGLIGRTGDGRPSGWAAADPLSFAAQADERIYLVGDMLDRVSPLFGHYPKSGHMASRQGRIAARQIAARAQGKVAARELPDSVCHLATQYDPPATLRIEASYRLRGDGEIAQHTATLRDAQPRGEDLAWAQAMFAEFLAPR